MATQKDVTDALKQFKEATTMKASAAAAAKVAQSFSELYEESAKNLLTRTPDLIDVLGAVQAGRLMERAAHKARTQGQQGALI